MPHMFCWCGSRSVKLHIFISTYIIPELYVSLHIYCAPTYLQGYLLLSTKVDANLSIKFHSYSTIILWLPVSKGFFLTFLFYVWICVCGYGCVCYGKCAPVRGQLWRIGYLLPCGSWDWNSGNEARQQASSPEHPALLTFSSKRSLLYISSLGLSDHSDIVEIKN